MRFKQFLESFDLSHIEVGQAADAHEPTGENRSSIDNPAVRMEINSRLMIELNQRFASPESGIQVIRKVLHRYGFDLPALYDADPEGDEVIIEINQFGQEDSTSNVYILYYLTDDGHYEFYSEVGDDSRMEEITSEEEDEQEEE